MMKKYLMTGLAAVALGGLFSSCSKDIETGEENTVEFNILQTYEDAFVTRFGQPAENQTWGFVSHSGTRSENANANEWADPNKAYGGLLVPPPLTDAQKAVVKKYFQTHPNLGYQDPGWSNYFIQQVYKGHTDVPANCATPEQYLAANGSSYIIASDHMDHLIAVDPEKGIYDHINNFNHGDCGENYNVLDNGGNANDGPFHTDKIMYMQNSTTKSFGYHNSDGSLYHTEYTGLVSYTTIMEAMGAEADCLNDGWKRSFMGFDFEQMVGDDVYSKSIETEGSWTSPENYEEGAQYINGFKVKSITYNTFEFEGKTYNFLTAETNMYAADLTEESYKQKNGSTSTTGGKANFNNTPSNDIIRDLLSKGYLPYSNTLKDWVKVGGTADGYFSDWIVTLTEAKTGTTPPPPTPPTGFVCRIVVEDLTVGERSDFDFNDVVFDVYQNGDLVIRAIGGQLPLYVEGVEVHGHCGVGVMDMVNTGWHNDGPNYNRTLGTISTGRAFGSRADAKGISIVVHKNDRDIQLFADKGKVASMIAVGFDFQWCSERLDIDAKFHKADGTKLFQQYVIGNLGDNWENGTAWYQLKGK